MELAALIISIISIVISIIFAILQINSDKKINDINLEAELSKEIFKDYLINRFPNAISEICFEKNKLSNIGKLQNELNSLRKDIRFFKYYDECFFEDFRTISQELEDYIVTNEGKEYAFDDQRAVNDYIMKKLSDVYTLIETKYKNG